jgi:hypothetical protein
MGFGFRIVSHKYNDDNILLFFVQYDENGEGSWVAVGELVQQQKENLDAIRLYLDSVNFVRVPKRVVGEDDGLWRVVDVGLPTELDRLGIFFLFCKRKV